MEKESLIKKYREELENCPLYGKCVDESGNIIDEEACKSDDIKQYMDCPHYNPAIAISIMEKIRLKILKFMQNEHPGLYKI